MPKHHIPSADANQLWFAGYRDGIEGPPSIDPAAGDRCHDAVEGSGDQVYLPRRESAVAPVFVAATADRPKDARFSQNNAPGVGALAAETIRHRESGDNHPGVIVRLNGHWRVIDSLEPYPWRQWILQQRKGRKWEGRSFCQTRKCIVSCIKEKVGLAEAPAVAHLPPRIADLLEAAK